MNNLQLSLLLDQYLTRINQAIDAAESELPDEMAQHGKNLIGHPVVSYPCMEPLRDLAEDLGEAVEKLQTQGDGSRQRRE